MQDTMQIDARIPGGNIIVKSIQGTQVLLNRDLRDTKVPWIYFKFRAVFPAPGTYTFQFDDGACLTRRGPAVSLDQGKHWDWLCKSLDLAAESFTFEAERAGEVWFCECIPYMQRELDEFLASDAGKSIELLELCKSRKGRKVELLRLGNGPRKIFLCSRHHCQESMATYALEGILTEVATHPQEFADFTFWAVPFVDKDGVEDGDQGKKRMPHDHGGDYGPAPIYPEVRANIELIYREQPELVFDLHCPWARYDTNEYAYFVGRANKRVQAGIDRFSSILAKLAPPDFPFDPRDNLPFGQAWNLGRNYEQGAPISVWAGSLPWNPSAQSMEIPFANSREVTLHADSARHLGHALARAIHSYLLD